MTFSKKFFSRFFSGFVLGAVVTFTTFFVLHRDFTLTESWWKVALIFLAPILTGMMAYVMISLGLDGIKKLLKTKPEDK